jgi:hypothetical protein
MPVRQQRFVFALTLPALWMLGYLGARAAGTVANEPDRLEGKQAG